MTYPQFFYEAYSSVSEHARDNSRVFGVGTIRSHTLGAASLRTYQQALPASLRLRASLR